ncbi:SWPV1-173 [Shearwaterpox virus]|uniref:SWPV1-173 n=1 Tax=Shearwaterpox virus TaxID=1974596 RepID=A0A1V0S855_CNPV|nr:SWPV1-173 [Shearwaterpox virus]
MSYINITPPYSDIEFKILVDGSYHLMFMVKNGYVNVTKMCKLENKEFYRWKRLVNSNKVIEDINSKCVPLETSSLIYVERKNNKNTYGFYAHPDLALQIAKWLSQDALNGISKIINIYKKTYDRDNNSLLCLEEELCPYDILGECEKGEKCEYMHGDICDICGMRALHLSNMEQRIMHESICIRFALKNIEEYNKKSGNNKEKHNNNNLIGDICGICLEHINEKPINDRVYGILSHCNHMFCFQCIKTWMKTINARGRCPECRQESDSITPSLVWIDKK